MPLENMFGDLALDATLEAVRDRIPLPTGAGRMPVDVGGNITVDALTISFESIISAGNSYQTPLDADETFTGVWEEVLDYAAISIAIMTDAGSAVNGAMAQFSVDGVTPTISQPTTIPAGGIQAYFTIPTQARYFRIVYTNGPVAQTVLASEITYRFSAPGSVQQPIGGQVTDQTVAEITSAGLRGRISEGPYTGMWVPLQVDAKSALKIVDEDVKRGITDTDQRFEWQNVGAEDKPLYIGVAVHGTLTSATWVIQKYTFALGPAGTYVPSMIETATGPWDDRATLF